LRRGRQGPRTSTKFMRRASEERIIFSVSSRKPRRLLTMLWRPRLRNRTRTAHRQHYICRQRATAADDNAGDPRQETGKPASAIAGWFYPYPALFCPLSVHLLDQYIVPLLNRATKLPYHSPCGVPNAVMLFTVVDIATGLLCPG